MTDRILEFLRNRREDGPCLVLDLDVVRDNYNSFIDAMPDTRVFYAVKANPDPRVLELLARLGSCFDTASVGEIEQVLASGASPDRISYGNTIKRSAIFCAPTNSACACLRWIARRKSKRSPALLQGPRYFVACSATALARNGLCRANSAATRNWRRGCSSVRIGLASLLSGCRFMSDRNSAILACGMAR